ncbi:MAG: cytosolic protein, partial [Magnetococcales bacterium]|nr:cytosolic protein [Magnetococcales bacterium]
DYSKADLQGSINPFAIVTLAHLLAKKTKGRMEDRYQEKWNLIRWLYRSGFNRQQVIDLFRFIDWVMLLPKELAKRLRLEIVELEESQNMPYISSIERIGEERGEKKGEKKGKAETLLKQLQRRFGAVPEAIQVKVASANLGELEIWLDRIFDADSAQAVLQ